MTAFSGGWPTARTAPQTNRAVKDSCSRLMNRFLRSNTALQNAPSESTRSIRGRRPNSGPPRQPEEGFLEYPVLARVGQPHGPPLLSVDKEAEGAEARPAHTPRAFLKPDPIPAVDDPAASPDSRRRWPP